MRRSLWFSLVVAVAALPSSAAAYQITGRWTSTVLNGSVGPRGNPVMLTWSIVDDGTPIDQGGNSNGSGLVSWLDDMFNVAPPPVPTDDYRNRPWFFLFKDSFDRIGSLAGVTYVYEPHDDAVITGTNGAYGVRGDVRITGKSLGVGSTSLAVNFFPNHSDMVINTDKTSFFDNTPNNYRGFRNVVMHEALHGLGITHVESSNADFLMDPFIQTHFEGPQLDEIIALQRNYGDRLEKSGNDSYAAATLLPAFGPGGGARVGQFGGQTRVEPNQIDFMSIDGTSDQDYYRVNLTQDSRLSVSLLPQGALYNQGPQGGSQSPFDSRTQSDLSLTLFDADGTTVLDLASDAGAGAGEFLGRLTPAGAYYVKIAGAQDQAQLYDLQLSAAPFTTDLVWKGGQSNDWNVAAAPNFTAGGAATSFFSSDHVSFVDNQAPKIVDIVESIAPASIVVDTTGRYIFQGAGSITAGSLTLNGAGELELAGAGNSFAGPTTINNGKLLVSGNANAMVTPITVAAGGTLVMDAADAASMASTIAIQSGGALEIGRATSSGNVFPDNPTSVVNDGTIRVLDDERISNVTGSGGLIAARETTTLGVGNAFTGSVVVNSGAALAGGGALTGAVQVDAGGTLSPGEGVGSLTVGAVTLAAGSTFAVEIGGAAANQFDALVATGAATLAGLLDVKLVDDFMPSAGDFFDIIAAADVDGVFDDWDLAPLSPTLDWRLSYDDDSLRLEVVSSLSEGDFNEDGSVDGDDLLAWQADFGRAGDAAHGNGDADLDLDVDGADFLIWQRQVSTNLAPPSGAPVPEPASAVLILGAIAAAIAAKRKHGAGSGARKLNRCRRWPLQDHANDDGGRV